MKYLGTLFFLAITLLSCGQSNNKSLHNRLTLKKNSISQIEISNYCGPMDSCQVITYKLTNSMKADLVERLNKSDLADTGEFTNLYWLKIYFTNSTIRTYITNGFLFKEVKENDDYPFYATKIEADDLCLKINDMQFIKNLWMELDKERIK